MTDLSISLFLLANFFQVGRHDILNSDVDRVAEQDGGRADDEADALEDKPEVNIKYLKFLLHLRIKENQLAVLQNFICH